MSIGDFHLHSTASDGVHSPSWVMEAAEKMMSLKGVKHVKLTTTSMGKEL